ncbi:MAG: 3-phosphoshikimate 1-carboxyvinyltransferase [Actinomycetota bacterium]
MTSLKGRLRPPGDKSISHRALIFEAMSGKTCDIHGLADGDDVSTTRDCLAHVGKGQLDCRNSGTTMRLLSGYLAPMAADFELVGDQSLSKRPMDWVATPLTQMGASFELHEGRFPPVRLKGGPLTAIEYELPVTSAQVKGAILLAGSMAEGTTIVTESRPTRDHTERMLQAFGADVVFGPGQIKVRPSTIEVFHLDVPGDISSAAFHIAAACLVADSEIVIEDVGLNPTRLGFLDLLSAMGANIETMLQTEKPEPTGEVVARSSQLHAITIEGDDIPRAIDEIPLLALLATQAEGTTIIRNAEELRAKESDRIKTICEGLRHLGANVEEVADGIVVSGPTRLSGGTVNSYGDHRIAMTFAVAGLISTDVINIEGWDCVSISYPGFARDLESLMK